MLASGYVAMELASSLESSQQPLVAGGEWRTGF